MPSGAADTYARNLNRQEGDWTGGSPQSAFMALHEQGVAMIDGRMFGLIQGRPMELTDELLKEMSGTEYTPMPGMEGYGQWNRESRGYQGGMGGWGGGEGFMGAATRPPMSGPGSTAVGDRPHGAMQGADLVQQPEMLSDMGTPSYVRSGYTPNDPRGREGQGAAAEHRQGVEDEYNYWLKQDEMDRQWGRMDDFASSGHETGARLVKRDPNRGTGPPPAMVPGGSAYEEAAEYDRRNR